MIKINKILIPVDFDNYARKSLDLAQPIIKALKYGCEFASRFDAELHVLHVVHNITEIEMCTQKAESDEKKKLNELLIQPTNQKVVIFREIRKGRPFIEIIKYAQEQSIDLIIMGTHRQKSLPHFFIGSDVENTVRKAPCPVLVVRHPEHEFVLP
ncbi:MAG: universal stress protein [Candidatus Omnitrophica bacterium]|nr:universal stress protein [Candidatus Omnitrophota bacterium]MBU1997414.1 universal stress protein [Candidatus Omnitrophota bacterium]MBU4334195.1 universal stress protein [Candidatus Omnitrophota bacterium]